MLVSEVKERQHLLLLVVGSEPELFCFLQNMQRFKQWLLCPEFAVSNCFVCGHAVMYRGVCVTHKIICRCLLLYACWRES